MLTAEKGLPSKPLDRSPPQPPNEPGFFASLFSAPAPATGRYPHPVGNYARGDDESPPTAMAQDEPPPPPRRQRRGWASGVLGWLFGDNDDGDRGRDRDRDYRYRDEEDRPPPPPPRDSLYPP
jgi:hypothetical protein